MENTIVIDELDSVGIEDRCEYLQDLFIARSDIYAQENEERRGYALQKEEITSAVLQAHLEGMLTIGIYPYADSTTKWLVFDWDDDDVSVLQTLKGVLATDGIDAYLEYSGRYWHLWVFFETPVENAIVRRFAEKVVAQAGYSGEIEIFPKQDSVEEYGNCINLPFGVNHKVGNRSYFVDDNLQEIDMEEFWSSVTKVSWQELAGIEANMASSVTDTGVTEDTFSVAFKEPCMQAYWDKGAEALIRHKVCYQLAIRLKEQKLGKKQALKALGKWQEMCDRGRNLLTDIEVTSVIKTVYSGKGRDEKAKCDSPMLKAKCVGRENCPFCQQFLRQRNAHRHKDEFYVDKQWQQHLSPGAFIMIRSALPYIEELNHVMPGGLLYTTTEELCKYSGLSMPGNVLRKLREQGLIEYTPNKRGGGKDRKPTCVRRIIPIPEPTP